MANENIKMSEYLSSKEGKQFLTSLTGSADTVKDFENGALTAEQAQQVYSDILKTMGKKPTMAAGGSQFLYLYDGQNHGDGAGQVDFDNKESVQVFIKFLKDNLSSALHAIVSYALDKGGKIDLSKKVTTKKKTETTPVSTGEEAAKGIEEAAKGIEEAQAQVQKILEGKAEARKFYEESINTLRHNVDEAFREMERMQETLKTFLTRKERELDKKFPSTSIAGPEYRAAEGEMNAQYMAEETRAIEQVADKLSTTLLNGGMKDKFEMFLDFPTWASKHPEYAEKLMPLSMQLVVDSTTRKKMSIQKLINKTNTLLYNYSFVFSAGADFEKRNKGVGNDGDSLMVSLTQLRENMLPHVETTKRKTAGATDEAESQESKQEKKRLQDAHNFNNFLKDYFPKGLKTTKEEFADALRKEIEGIVESFKSALDPKSIGSAETETIHKFHDLPSVSKGGEDMKADSVGTSAAGILRKLIKKDHSVTAKFIEKSIDVRALRAGGTSVAAARCKALGDAVRGQLAVVKKGIDTLYNWYELLSTEPRNKVDAEIQFKMDRALRNKGLSSGQRFDDIAAQSGIKGNFDITSWSKTRETERANEQVRDLVLTKAQTVDTVVDTILTKTFNIKDRISAGVYHDIGEPDARINRDVQALYTGLLNAYKWLEKQDPTTIQKAVDGWDKFHDKSAELAKNIKDSKLTLTKLGKELSVDLGDMGKLIPASPVASKLLSVERMLQDGNISEIKKLELQKDKKALEKQDATYNNTFKGVYGEYGLGAHMFDVVLDETSPEFLEYSSSAKEFFTKLQQDLTDIASTKDNKNKVTVPEFFTTVDPNGLVFNANNLRALEVSHKALEGYLSISSVLVSLKDDLKMLLGGVNTVGADGKDVRIPGISELSALVPYFDMTVAGNNIAQYYKNVKKDHDWGNKIDNNYGIAGSLSGIMQGLKTAANVESSLNEFDNILGLYSGVSVDGVEKLKKNPVHQEIKKIEHAREVLTQEERGAPTEKAPQGILLSRHSDEASVALGTPGFAITEILAHTNKGAIKEYIDDCENYFRQINAIKKVSDAPTRIKRSVGSMVRHSLGIKKQMEKKAMVPVHNVLRKAASQTFEGDILAGAKLLRKIAKLPWKLPSMAPLNPEYSGTQAGSTKEKKSLASVEKWADALLTQIKDLYEEAKTALSKTVQNTQVVNYSSLKKCLAISGKIKKLLDKDELSRLGYNDLSFKAGVAISEHLGSSTVANTLDDIITNLEEVLSNRPKLGTVHKEDWDYEVDQNESYLHNVPLMQEALIGISNLSPELTHLVSGIATNVQEVLGQLEEMTRGVPKAVEKIQGYLSNVQKFNDFYMLLPADKFNSLKEISRKELGDEIQGDSWESVVAGLAKRGKDVATVLPDTGPVKKAIKEGDLGGLTTAMVTHAQLSTKAAKLQAALRKIESYPTPDTDKLRAVKDEIGQVGYLLGIQAEICGSVPKHDDILVPTGTIEKIKDTLSTAPVREYTQDSGRLKSDLKLLTELLAEIPSIKEYTSNLAEEGYLGKEAYKNALEERVTKEDAGVSTSNVRAKFSEAENIAAKSLMHKVSLTYLMRHTPEATQVSDGLEKLAKSHDMRKDVFEEYKKLQKSAQKGPTGPSMLEALTTILKEWPDPALRHLVKETEVLNASGDEASVTGASLINEAITHYVGGKARSLPAALEHTYKEHLPQSFKLGGALDFVTKAKLHPDLQGHADMDEFQDLVTNHDIPSISSGRGILEVLTDSISHNIDEMHPKAVPAGVSPGVHAIYDMARTVATTLSSGRSPGSLRDVVKTVVDSAMPGAGKDPSSVKEVLIALKDLISGNGEFSHEMATDIIDKDGELTERDARHLSSAHSAKEHPRLGEDLKRATADMLNQADAAVDRRAAVQPPNSSSAEHRIEYRTKVEEIEKRRARLKAKLDKAKKERDAASLSGNPKALPNLEKVVKEHEDSVAELAQEEARALDTYTSGIAKAHKAVTVNPVHADKYVRDYEKNVRLPKVEALRKERDSAASASAQEQFPHLPAQEAAEAKKQSVAGYDDALNKEMHEINKSRGDSSVGISGNPMDMALSARKHHLERASEARDKIQAFTTYKREKALGHDDNADRINQQFGGAFETYNKDSDTTEQTPASVVNEWKDSLDDHTHRAETIGKHYGVIDHRNQHYIGDPRNAPKYYSGVATNVTESVASRYVLPDASLFLRAWGDAVSALGKTGTGLDKEVVRKITHDAFEASKARLAKQYSKEQIEGFTYGGTAVKGKLTELLERKEGFEKDIQKIQERDEEDSESLKELNFCLAQLVRDNQELADHVNTVVESHNEALHNRKIKEEVERKKLKYLGLDTDLPENLIRGDLKYDLARMGRHLSKHLRAKRSLSKMSPDLMAKTMGALKKKLQDIADGSMGASQIFFTDEEKALIGPRVAKSIEWAAKHSDDHEDAQRKAKTVLDGADYKLTTPENKFKGIAAKIKDLSAIQDNSNMAKILKTKPVEFSDEEYGLMGPDLEEAVKAILSNKSRRKNKGKIPGTYTNTLNRREKAWKKKLQVRVNLIPEEEKLIGVLSDTLSDYEDSLHAYETGMGNIPVWLNKDDPAYIEEESVIRSSFAEERQRLIARIHNISSNDKLVRDLSNALSKGIKADAPVDKEIAWAENFREVLNTHFDAKAMHNSVKLDGSVSKMEKHLSELEEHDQEVVPNDPTARKKHEDRHAEILKNLYGSAREVSNHSTVRSDELYNVAMHGLTSLSGSKLHELILKNLKYVQDNDLDNILKDKEFMKLVDKMTLLGSNAIVDVSGPIKVMINNKMTDLKTYTDKLLGSTKDKPYSARDRDMFCKLYDMAANVIGKYLPSLMSPKAKSILEGSKIAFGKRMDIRKQVLENALSSGSMDHPAILAEIQRLLTTSGMTKAERSSLISVAVRSQAKGTSAPKVDLTSKLLKKSLNDVLKTQKSVKTGRLSAKDALKHKSVTEFLDMERAGAFEDVPAGQRATVDKVVTWTTELFDVGILDNIDDIKKTIASEMAKQDPDPRELASIKRSIDGVKKVGSRSGTHRAEIQSEIEVLDKELSQVTQHLTKGSRKEVESLFETIRQIPKLLEVYTSDEAYARERDNLLAEHTAKNGTVKANEGVLKNLANDASLANAIFEKSVDGPGREEALDAKVKADTLVAEQERKLADMAEYVKRINSQFAKVTPEGFLDKSHNFSINKKKIELVGKLNDTLSNLRLYPDLPNLSIPDDVLAALKVGPEDPLYLQDGKAPLHKLVSTAQHFALQHAGLLVGNREEGTESRESVALKNTNLSSIARGSWRVRKLLDLQKWLGDIQQQSPGDVGDQEITNLTREYNYCENMEVGEYLATEVDKLKRATKEQFDKFMKLYNRASTSQIKTAGDSDSAGTFTPEDKANTVTKRWVGDTGPGEEDAAAEHKGPKLKYYDNEDLRYQSEAHELVSKLLTQGHDVAAKHVGAALPGAHVHKEHRRQEPVEVSAEHALRLLGQLSNSQGITDEGAKKKYEAFKKRILDQKKRGKGPLADPENAGISPENLFNRYVPAAQQMVTSIDKLNGTSDAAHDQVAGFGSNFDNLAGAYHATRKHLQSTAQKGMNISPSLDKHITALAARWEKMGERLEKRLTVLAMRHGAAKVDPKASSDHKHALSTALQDTTETLNRHKELTNAGADWEPDSDTIDMASKLHQANLEVKDRLDSVVGIIGSGETKFRGGAYKVSEVYDTLNKGIEAVSTSQFHARQLVSHFQKMIEELDKQIHSYQEMLQHIREEGSSTGLSDLVLENFAKQYISKLFEWIMDMWNKNPYAFEVHFGGSNMDYNKFFEMHKEELGVRNNKRISRAIIYISNMVKDLKFITRKLYPQEMRELRVLLNTRDKLFRDKYSLSAAGIVKDGIYAFLGDNDISPKELGGPGAQFEKAVGTHAKVEAADEAQLVQGVEVFQRSVLESGALTAADVQKYLNENFTAHSASQTAAVPAHPIGTPPELHTPVEPVSPTGVVPPVVKMASTEEIAEKYASQSSGAVTVSAIQRLVGLFTAKRG